MIPITQLGRHMNIISTVNPKRTERLMRDGHIFSQIFYTDDERVMIDSLLSSSISCLTLYQMPSAPPKRNEKHYYCLVLKQYFINWCIAYQKYRPHLRDFLGRVTTDLFVNEDFSHIYIGLVDECSPDPAPLYRVRMAFSKNSLYSSFIFISSVTDSELRCFANRNLLPLDIAFNPN